MSKGVTACTYIYIEERILSTAAVTSPTKARLDSLLNPRSYSLLLAASNCSSMLVRSVVCASAAVCYSCGYLVHTYDSQELCASIIHSHRCSTSDSSHEQIACIISCACHHFHCTYIVTQRSGFRLYCGWIIGSADNTFIIALPLSMYN